MTAMIEHSLPAYWLMAALFSEILYIRGVRTRAEFMSVTGWICVRRTWDVCET